MGHQVVGGAVANQLAVLGRAGQHLVGGDRCVELRRQRSVSLEVVGIQRLFDPDQIELLEDAAHALSSRPVPLLVRVDHQRRFIAQVLANGLDALDVERAIGLADLELDATDAALAGSSSVHQQLIERRRSSPGAGCRPSAAHWPGRDGEGWERQPQCKSGQPGEEFDDVGSVRKPCSTQ